MPVKPLTDLESLIKLAKNRPHSELLQSPLWGEVQKAAGRHIFYWGLFKNNQPEAACLIIKHSLPLGKSWLYSPRLVWPSQYIPQLIDEICQVARQENSIFWKIELRIGNRESGIQIPNSKFQILNSLSLQPPETFIINLTQSDDQLLQNMKPKTRYNIRLAQKKGVEVRWSKNINNDVNIFYDLLGKTARRQKITLHPKFHYQNIINILRTENAGGLAIAEFRGEPLAANLVSFFGDTAVYLHGGTSMAHRPVMSPYLLQWETMLEAKRRNCQYYDLGGCAVKTGKIKDWADITRFKSGWGGQLKQFGTTYDVVFNKQWYWLYKIGQISRRLATKTNL